MTDTGTDRAADRPTHTDDRRVVFAAERLYLEERRRRNGLPSLDDEPDLWGLAFSGGGVRSATFCLGVMQALTTGPDGLMKRFDYLSTVSGGGYIGSCLSSLLSGRDDTGLDHATSPFTGLREHDDYDSPDRTELGVRHQIHHLRTHGEYLIPRSRLMSRDVQRAVGSVVPGIFHTVTLFLLALVALVAATHLVLAVIEPDLETLAPTGELVVGSEDMSTLEFVAAVPKAWLDDRIAPPVRELWRDARARLPILALLLLPGVLWNLGAVALATRLARTFDPESFANRHPIRSGWTAEEEREARFVARFNLWSVLLAVAIMLGLATGLRLTGPSDHALATLLVPLALALGGFAASHVATYVWETKLSLDAWRVPGADTESRFRRSLHASIRGACIYGVVVAAGTPVVLVILFSLSSLPLKFFLSLGSLAIAYIATRGAGDAAALQLGGWLKRPLANIAVLLFLAFAFAQISTLLLELYRDVGGLGIAAWSAGVGAASLLLCVLFAVVVDANRISPHYFYRDRLTEAYLKTDARVTRPDGSDSQGMPLCVLRDDEDLLLSALGEGNGRGPYHLIVAAINLSGSNELNRKSFLSEHFIFSRDFIGSRVTGWVPTTVYRGGRIRVARAMTISAAAVGSAMGPNTFAAQAFVATLLNARLGFWTDNPWSYRRGAPTGTRFQPTFWPRYLIREALGKASARLPRVNVSDGGHTGDNLGLLPLLERRCETIVVCDAEADGDLTFGSFNNAVRMALTEENIEIDIDLVPIMERKKTAGGYRASMASVAVGTIAYPEAGPDRPAFTGRLVVVKASVNRSGAPVHVANYAKGHPSFPHETTADQFFDDAQLEAYRALGECLGRQAAERLRESRDAAGGVA